MKPIKTNLGELLNSDALGFIKNIPDNSIDLILTDPPYLYNMTEKNIRNTNLEQMSEVEFRKRKNQNDLIQNNIHKSIDIKTYCDQFLRISKNNFMLIWMNHHQIKEYLDWVTINKLKFNFYIWEKTNPMPLNTFVYQDKEYCMIIYDDKKKIPNYLNSYKNKKTILKYPIGQEANGHPTVKPLKMMEFLIEKHSKPNDLVLDPFMGSGTTALACEHLERRWLGTEINEKFFIICQERLTYIQKQLIFNWESEN